MAVGKGACDVVGQIVIVCKGGVGQIVVVGKGGIGQIVVVGKGGIGQIVGKGVFDGVGQIASLSFSFT